MTTQTEKGQPPHRPAGERVAWTSTPSDPGAPTTEAVDSTSTKLSAIADESTCSRCDALATTNAALLEALRALASERAIEDGTEPCWCGIYMIGQHRPQCEQARAAIRLAVDRMWEDDCICDQP